MARKKSTKKLRGSRGERLSSVDGAVSEKAGPACDLMVAMPKNTSKVKVQLLIKEIKERLSTTGFTHMGLTYTIYGTPRPVEDRASTALPSTLWEPTERDTNEPEKKKRKADTSTKKSSSKPKVIRRIHSVLENISDVGAFLLNSSQAEVLREYDLVSIAPRNDATFQSACATATLADIITLDYSSTRGMKLPFKIRPSDVQAVMDRKAAFEIPIAPALLNVKYRKALAQTCAELQASCLRKKPLILFSSGERKWEDSDAGSMAFRMPGDLSNLMQVVFHFDPTVANNAVGKAALAVIENAQIRRWGKLIVSNIRIGNLGDDDSDDDETNDTTDKKVESSRAETKAPATAKQQAPENDDSSESNIEDGFISMI